MLQNLNPCESTDMIQLSNLTLFREKERESYLKISIGHGWFIGDASTQEDSRKERNYTGHESRIPDKLAPEHTTEENSAV